MSEKIEVGLDKTPEDVIQYDAEGKDLVFKEGLGELLELSDEQVRSLSKANQTNYWVAFALNRKLREQQEAPPTPGLRVENRSEPAGQFGSDAFKREAVEMNKEVARKGAKMGTAKGRLQIHWKDPASAEKFDTVWKRPDELRDASYRGYVPITTDEADGYTASPSGRVEVAAFGETELVAMKIPKATHEEVLSEPRERSKKRAALYDAAAKKDLEQAGGHPFDPSKPKQGTTPWRKLS